MVLSAVTALYIGTSAYTKAYIGATQVWPVSAETTGYTLQKVATMSALTRGDKYVLISATNTKIVGRSNDTWYNLTFSGFDGDGTYSALPNYTCVFVSQNRNDNHVYIENYPNNTRVYTYAESSTILQLSISGSYSFYMSNYNNGVCVMGDSTSTSGGFAAYLNAASSVPQCKKNVTGSLYYIYKLTVNL